MNFTRSRHFLTRYPHIGTTVLVGSVVLGLDATVGGTAGRWLATVYVAVFAVWTFRGMVRQLLSGHVGLDVLAVVAMSATLAVGEYLAALIVVLMLAGGQALEDIANRRAKHELTALLDRSPRTAHRFRHLPGAAAPDLEDVDVEEVRVGETLLVRPSELVPIDGVLVSETGTFDLSSLTGESMPVRLAADEEVPSGAVNGAVAISLRVLRPSSESQYQQIVVLVKDAQESRAPVVRLADRFALPFTLLALTLAGFAWWQSGNPTRFAEVLVLATPCPLLIAAPVAFLGGLSRAARAGVILKSGAVIEQLARVRSAAFDKTGTLSQGHPTLVAVRPAQGFDAATVLRLAASAEQYSTHALAEGIRIAATRRGLRMAEASEASETATNGVRAVIDGCPVAVGKRSYVASLASGVVPADLTAGQAGAYVAIGGVYAGALILADDARPEAASVVDWLSRHGVERIVMFSGDAGATAAAIAAEVGITEVHADLHPADKVRLAEALRPRPMLMVGDGVNDAPVLAAADVGVALGARGATAAGEAASAVILADSLLPILDAITISRHTLKVALTAIWIGMLLSTALMLIATTGAIPAVAGALAQELVDLATILYALRALAAPRSSPHTRPVARR